MRGVRFFHAVGLLSVSISGAATAEPTVVTLNTSGNWSNGANWSSNPVVPNNGQPAPTDTYAVNIFNRIATLDQDVVITDLTLGHTSGITNAINDLSGVPKMLTVQRQFDYIQGILTGANTYVIAPGAVMNFLTTPASQTKQLNALLKNMGTMNFNANTSLLSTAPGTNLTNESGAVININNTTAFSRTAGSTDAVLKNKNGAVFNQEASTTTTINWIFDNDGTVNVNNGALSANRGGTHTGTFNVAANRNLTFGGTGFTHTLGPGSALRGNGTATFNTPTTVQCADEDFTIKNLSVNTELDIIPFIGTPEEFEAINETVSVTSGKLSGGNFNTSMMTWIGGTIESNVTIRESGFLNATFTPNPISPRKLGGRFENYGFAAFRNTIDTDSSAGPATFVNYGTVNTTLTTAFTGNGKFINDGHINVVSGITTVTVNFETTDQSNLEVTSGVTLVVEDPAPLRGDVTIGQNAAVNAVLVDAETLLKSHGLDMYLNGSFNVSSMMRSADFRADEASTLRGSGSINISGRFEAFNVTSPGDSPGTLTITALELAMQESHRLDMEFGAPGSEDVDLLIVNGDLTLDGTLNVTALDGFDIGTYTLIEYSGALVDLGLEIGMFPEGFAGSIDLTTPGEVRLIVAAPPSNCPGDADGNGIVNFADITSVLTVFNTMTEPFGFGDADGNGVVNFADITMVLTSFGQVCP